MNINSLLLLLKLAKDKSKKGNKMKRVLASALCTSFIFASNSNASLQKEIEALKAKISQLEKQVKENKNLTLSNMKKVDPIYANHHLYLSYDLRTSFDFIEYKLNQAGNKDKLTNNILSNRVIVTGVARPSENLKATLEIAANDIAGMNSIDSNSYQNTPWVANETPDDITVRVKQAFINYFFGPNNGFMLASGRVPSTEGFPANLRNNDSEAAPLAHLINMEFDGFAFDIKNSIFSNISEKFTDWGTWIKFCAGRGYSSANPKFSQYPYSKDNLSITDFAGFKFIAYDDGQYSLKTQSIWAWNLKGYKNLTDYKNNKMNDLGNYFGQEILFEANGIGNEISDFLDNTIAFIDFALSKTMPKGHNAMQGTTDNKIGTSIWIGAQMPVGNTNDTWGFNYIHGTKYFKAFTYGEDTLIGSIASTRGNAYELYYNKTIIPHLTAQIRATYINYTYTGSNGFFGITSKPIKVKDDLNPAVDKAYDIRAYIRYNF